MILCRKRSKNRTQKIVPLGRGQSLFGIGSGIELPLDQVAIRFGAFANFMSRASALQGKIVHDSKKPAAEILAGPAELEMTMQREEHFLNDFLPIVHGKAKRKGVSQQAITKFVEQAYDFIFQVAG
ncbi:MAG: hypothetical protein WA621_06005 [Candidatus Acidiferrum sp.]